jgi:hypothetical protein
MNESSPPTKIHIHPSMLEYQQRYLRQAKFRLPVTLLCGLLVLGTMWFLGRYVLIPGYAYPVMAAFLALLWLTDVMWVISLRRQGASRPTSTR